MNKLQVTCVSLFLLFTSNTYSQECKPDFQMVFDIPVGSEFQYRTTTIGESPYQDVRVESFTIVDIWNVGDTIFYQRNGFFTFTRYRNDSEIVIEQQYEGTIDDVIKHFDEPDNYLNLCSNELVALDIDEDEEYYSYVKTNDLDKTIGGVGNLYRFDENQILVDVNDENPYNVHFEQIYKKGVGLMYSSSGNIMSSSITICEDYSVSGVNAISTSIDDKMLSKSLKVYPNLIQDNEKVRISSETEFNYLIITSIEGKLITQKYLNQDFIDLDDQPKGVYFLTFVFDNDKITRKVFKY